MAAKIIANLIILGSGVLLRAFSQAYRQALANASKSGVAQEVAQHTRRHSKAMTVQEARMVLGVTDKTTWEDVLERYEKMYANNERAGSFYLLSKVHRAKEALEAEVAKSKEGASQNSQGPDA